MIIVANNFLFMYSMLMVRKIIHIDMDCFYAAVELRDRPELQGRPVAVGGAASRRGVLCTSNYQARKCGVRSAMSSAHAVRLCPDLTILPVDMAKYREVSKRIRQIFYEYTDLIEPLSLDEVYLDVSDSQACQNSATRIAQAIRQRIYNTEQLTASAGVASNKYLAKIASDWRKPNGQFVIAPHAVEGFIKTLPVSKIFGVGKVTAKKLQQMAIHTFLDLQRLSKEELVLQFGKFGRRLYQLARGVDDRPVEPSRVRKSLSVEHTYPEDLPTLTACQQQLPRLLKDLTARLQQHEHRLVHKQFVKVKFNNFQVTTVESVVSAVSYDLFTELLATGFKRQGQPVRLLGVGVGFAESDSLQAQLEL